MYAALYFFFLNDSYFSNPEKYFAIIQIGVVTIALPVLFFFVLRSFGQIDSMMVADVSQRKIPLVILCFLIILLVRKSITFERFPELHFFFLGGLVSTMLALILSFFKTKASLHLMTISGLTLFIIGLSIHNQTQSTNMIAFLVLMNGVVASSRLEMKAHTVKELIIGLSIGIIPQLFLFRFWL